MTDLRTISPDELTELGEIPNDLRAVVFSPGGPLQKIPHERLLTKLIATSLCKATKAALDSDFAHAADSVALVFADPVAALNGWYRKLGASGAGSWEQFEELARNSRVLAEAAATAAANNANSAGVERLAAEAAATRAENITQALTINFANAPTEGSVILAANYSNPATRYSSSVDGSGFLDVTAIQVAAMVAGWRSRASGKVGRTFTAIGVCGAAGFDTAIGLAIGFDAGRSTGANAQGLGDSRYIVWRSNGVIEVQNGEGTNRTTAEGFTLTAVSGAVPTFVAGDVLTGTLLVESVDGIRRGLLTLQRGTSTGVVRISPLPAGFAFAGFRVTGNADAALRQTGKLRFFGYFDSTVQVTTQQVTNVIGTLVSTAMADPFRIRRAPATVDDAQAFTTRVKPAAIRQPPCMPMIVHSAGDVTFDRQLLAAFLSRYPDVRTGAIAFLSPTGNDGTAVVGDRTRPFATSTAALNSAALVVAAEDGAYPPIDYRRTQAAGGRAKLFTAINPGRVTLRVPGPDLTTLTFTDTGDGVWQFTWPAGNIAIHRLLRRDVLDMYGLPAEMPQAASDAALRAATSGWRIDTATRTGWVKLGAGISVQANRAQLEPKWTDANGNARCMALDAILFTHGIVLDGVTCLALSTGAQRPELWRQNFTQLYSNDYGLSVGTSGGGQGGSIYQMDGTVHSCFRDGWNAFQGPDSDYFGGGIITRESGAVDSFGVNAGGSGSNKQAGSSHIGSAVEIGCVAQNNNGQQWADTSVAGASNPSWVVACRDLGSRHAAANPNTSDVGFGIYGTGTLNPSSRIGWFDTCVSLAPIPAAVEGGAVMRLFNCSFGAGAVRVVAPSVLPTVYAPGAP